MEDIYSLAKFPHVQHLLCLLFCVCDCWPGRSVEIKRFISRLPVVKLLWKLSRITTPYSPSEETVGVRDCKHTLDEWRFTDHTVLLFKRHIFGYWRRSLLCHITDRHLPVSSKTSSSSTLKISFCYSVFLSFSSEISKQPCASGIIIKKNCNF